MLTFYLHPSDGYILFSMTVKHMFNSLKSSVPFVSLPKIYLKVLFLHLYSFCFISIIQHFHLLMMLLQRYLPMTSRFSPQLTREMMQKLLLSQQLSLCLIGVSNGNKILMLMKKRHVLFQLHPTTALGNLPSSLVTTKFQLIMLHVSLASFWTAVLHSMCI